MYGRQIQREHGLSNGLWISIDLIRGNSDGLGEGAEGELTEAAAPAASVGPATTTDAAVLRSTLHTKSLVPIFPNNLVYNLPPLFSSTQPITIKEDKYRRI